MVTINTAAALPHGDLSQGQDDRGQCGNTGMLLAHKIALQPNNRQRTYFAKAAGTARFAYNWALAAWKEQYERHRQDPTQPKPSQFSLRRELNAFPGGGPLVRQRHGANTGPIRSAASRKPRRGGCGSGGVSNIRQDALHQLTSSLTQRFHTIGIEDLNVSGMVQNRCLSRAISDRGFFEFRRQLDYKAGMRGGQVIIVERWYPSSKRCAHCGHTADNLPLSVRRWTCAQCSTAHDRDVNAARNLKDEAESLAASACGEEGAGPGLQPRVKPASVKQEVSIKPEKQV